MENEVNLEVKVTFARGKRPRKEGGPRHGHISHTAAAKPVPRRRAQAPQPREGRGRQRRRKEAPLKVTLPAAAAEVKEALAHQEQIPQPRILLVA